MKKETLKEWEGLLRKKYSPDYERYYHPDLIQIKYIMSINDNIEEHNNLMKELIEVLKSNNDVDE